MKKQNTYPELKAVRTSLQELHRILLLNLKKDREKISGKLMNPAEWFQQLISAPELQWIKPLNSLLSDMDALSELERTSEVDLSIVRQELEAMFFVENDEVTSFNYHYRQIFNKSHEVMFLHGSLKEAVMALPNLPKPSNSEEIRKNWHMTGASKRKLMN